MKKLLLIAAISMAACAAPTQEVSAESYTSQYVLVVKGMSCPNCANNITHELMALPGVEDVRIDMGTGSVLVLSNGALPSGFEMQEAVRSAGFTPVTDGK